MTLVSRLACAGTRTLAAGLLLAAGCHSLPTHPFQDNQTTVQDTYVAWDTAAPNDQGVEAWGFRGAYTVDVDASTLGGETTMFDEVQQNTLGQYQVGDLLCQMTWPVTQADDPVPTTACADCTFALMVLWDDGTQVSSFFPGLGFEPDYPSYGAVVMDLYGGAWTPIATATFDGTTLSFERLFGYYYYY